jgi:hypothetical protein
MPKVRLPFKTRREVERYFGGKRIECLLCGEWFHRLSGHLATKHSISTDDYKHQFGLPWSRGLVSESSRAKSGWNEQRRAKQRKLVSRTRFFKFAHPASRRQVAPFLRAEDIRKLGTHAVGFSKRFESEVRSLFRKGLTDEAIAQALGVNRMTVNKRTRRWRSAGRKYA